MGLTVCLKKGRVLISVPNYLIWGEIRWVKDSKTHISTSPCGEEKEMYTSKEEPPLGDSELQPIRLCRLGDSTVRI